MSDEPIKPGQVRTFKRGNGNAVVLAIGVWAEHRRKRLHIHMTGPKEYFHTTVTNDPQAERYHRTLFRNLRKVLIDNQAWPYGNEGAETERRA